LTGTHWADTGEYATLKNIGYGFAITNVGPTDMAGAKAKLDAAKAAGIRLIIGIYAFGGPEPYVWTGSAWTISTAARQMLDYFETRQDEIIALFVFNEPYWLNPLTGAQDACGATSAAQLRSLRTEIKKVWPAAKIYHDIGHPAGWAPGGYLYNAHPCIGDKYADATGVADYVGVYDYPFRTAARGGYVKSESLATLARETQYVTDKMGAVPVWLAQSQGGVDGLVWPTQAQMLDQNCSIRAALPANALISWYVWRQGIYPDYLAKYPAYWALTSASACT
jgi:hypothetical protein